ncbi:MAG: ligase-associated DNA damage response endonuclease PdeM [Bacteroidota bacterium]
MIVKVQGQQLHLHPHRAIYWVEEDCLLIADLHLGKAAHFRKEGLAAPAAIMRQNLQVLRELLEAFEPSRVLFLGDLFHSRINRVWEAFVDLIWDFGEISFELVQGNHDILPHGFYEQAALKLYTEPLILPPFIFSHYPLEGYPKDLYNLYGHLHPGVLLEGLGKQELRLPCFHFGQRQAVLPAFGQFTGLAIIQPKRSDRVYVIAEGEVLAVGS